MSSTLVCFLVHGALFISIYLMPSITLHFTLDPLKFCSRVFIRLQVSDPYVRTGRMY